MPGTNTIPQQLDFKPVRQFLAPFCDLSTIASLTLVNRLYRDAYQSNESEPCMEHFGIANWYIVKEIFLSLPSSLRTKVARNELRLLDAEQFMMPWSLRQKIKSGDLTLAQARKQLRNLSASRNILDFLRDLDPNFECDGFDALDDVNFTCREVGFWNTEIVRTSFYHDEIAASIKQLLNVKQPFNLALAVKLCNEGIPAAEQLSENEMTSLLATHSHLLYKLAFQYARQTGVITKAMLLNEEPKQLAIIAANANLPAARQISQFNSACYGMLLNKNTLLGLEHGFLKVANLETVTLSTDDSDLLEYMLSDMGFDLLIKTGSIQKALEIYPNSHAFFTAFYGVELGELPSAQLNDTNNRWVATIPINAYIDYLTSLATKRCLQKGYLTPHELVLYAQYYSHVYLLLSEMGNQGFKEKRVNIASAFEIPPSNLAKILSQSPQQFFSEHRHKDRETQQAYDRQFGLIARPAQ